MTDPDPHVLRDGHLPTPFTAAEIRLASPLGRLIRQRVEEIGQPARTVVQQYIEVDAESGTRHIATVAPDGSELDVRVSRSTWLQLQGHASFPAASTTVEPETIETPMGSLEGLRYVATDGDDVTTFWFASALPGMPVRVERRVAGRLVEQVTMLSSVVEPVREGVRPAEAG